MSRPVIIDALLRWRHRGSFLVLWDDVQRMEPHRVELRDGYRREPSALEAAGRLILRLPAVATAAVKGLSPTPRAAYLETMPAVTWD